MRRKIYNITLVKAPHSVSCFDCHKPLEENSACYRRKTNEYFCIKCGTEKEGWPVMRPSWMQTEGKKQKSKTRK